MGAEVVAAEDFDVVVEAGLFLPDDSFKDVFDWDKYSQLLAEYSE